MLLVGDLGGTNVRLAVVEDDGRRSPAERFEAAAFDSFASLLDAFLTLRPQPIDALCLGVAGPVSAGRATMTNLGWDIDAARLQRSHGFRQVMLLNDLEAAAYAIGGLGDDDFTLLHEGVRRERGNVAVIAAGTGLGEAFTVAGDAGELVVATEGGHTDFAPADPLQDELLQYCRSLRSHVSYEFVCSGPGIGVIFRFLRARGGAALSPALAARIDAVTDPVPAIIEAALGAEPGNEMCAQTLELFANIFAAEAGNLALKVTATGGIWITGGIAPRILPLLRRPSFVETVAAKGRMSALVASMPVAVVTASDAALAGAARYALRR